jgi:phosphoribosylglycinamide formyltransferase 2
MAGRDSVENGASPIPGTLLLLGAGELGKELAISAQRLGMKVVAADRYEGAPAMHVAHVSEVLSLMDGAALEGVIRTHRPDLIVPEVEAVSAETLRELESEGFNVVPSARAASLVADRTFLRQLAFEELGLRTPRLRTAGSLDELRESADQLGFPVMVKPPSGISGRGQSLVTGPSRLERAWHFAVEEMDVDPARVVVEEYIDFESEITLLSLRENDGTVRIFSPIGHRQDRGGYRESWTPCEVVPERLSEAEAMAREVMGHLGGAGIAGVEFFLTGDEAIFSEISLGPHDTGMVTLISQELSQFDLHLRAILGHHIPKVQVLQPSASAVILSDVEGPVAGYRGVDRALQVEGVQVRIFGKPQAETFRRMGVALATGATVQDARERALEAAGRVSIVVR